jgi:hypothetical protein
MKGFAVLSMARENEIRDRYPLMSKVWGIDRLIQPYTDREIDFKTCTGAHISVPTGFEKSKLKRAARIGTRKYGHLVSRDYGINYNPFFHHSCLVRAFDFFTIAHGCDLRLNEVVIADGATYEGRNTFRLLLPFCRRIILVTDNKKELLEEVDYAILKYGTSVAVLEDPIKASERADAVIITSDSPHHEYLLNLKRPMLFIRFAKKPTNKLWFDNILVEFESYRELDPIYAQGYVDFLSRKPIWNSAERDGFRIYSLRKSENPILER